MLCFYFYRRLNQITELNAAGSETKGEIAGLDVRFYPFDSFISSNEAHP